MSNYKLRCNGLLGGTLKWSMGYNIVSTAALATVASTFDTAIGTLWTTATNGLQNFTHTDVTVVNTTVYQVNNIWFTTNKAVTAHAIAGTDANTTPHYSLAAFVFMNSTNAQGKSYRGHIKMPPFANDTMAAGLLTAGVVTSLTTVWQAFFTTMKGLAGYSVVSYNRKPNKALDVAFTQHQLTAFTIPNKIGSNEQRADKQLATNSGTGTL